MGGELRPAFIRFSTRNDVKSIHLFDSSLLLIGTESNNFSPLGSGFVIKVPSLNPYEKVTLNCYVKLPQGMELMQQVLFSCALHLSDMDSLSFDENSMI
jgi:hypothetical protein